MSDSQREYGAAVALPATFAIADPQARAWAEAMASAWSVRNGGGGPEDEQFVRRADIGRATDSAVVRVLSQAFGSPVQPGAGSPGASAVQALIDDVLSSRVVEYLRTPLQQISIPAAKLGALETLIARESQIRQDGDAALASLVTTVSAGSGAFEPFQKWEFDSSTEGWTTSGATLSTPGEYMRVSSVGVDPILRSQATFINGAANDKVRMRLRRISGTGWDGHIFYFTPSHNDSASFVKSIPAPAFIGNDWLIVEWDMAALTAGGTDWTTSTITLLRIDLGAVAGDVFDIDWIAVGKRGVGVASASVVQEITTRSNKDNSLAQAINTMWSVIGSSSALIQDGALAAVSPAAVAATRWLQVQAAVTDPNTGLVNAVSIKQELSAYASAANGVFNTTYSLRLNSNGAIAGFSLMSTSGAGSAVGGVSSTFAIVADKLALVSPSNALVVPFAVDGAGNATYSGYIYAAGGVFSGQLLVGNVPSIFGTTMNGSGAIINANGTFAIGNSAGNITYNGTSPLTLNGQVVGTTNLFANAVTNAVSGSVTGFTRNNVPGFSRSTLVGIGTIATSAAGSGRVTIQLSPSDWSSAVTWQLFSYMLANASISGTGDFQTLTFNIRRNGIVIRSQTNSGTSTFGNDSVRFCSFALINDMLTPGSAASYALEIVTTSESSTNQVHEVISFDYLITEAKR